MHWKGEGETRTTHAQVLRLPFRVIIHHNFILDQGVEEIGAGCKLEICAFPSKLSVNACIKHSGTYVHLLQDRAFIAMNVSLYFKNILNSFSLNIFL